MKNIFNFLKAVLFVFLFAIISVVANAQKKYPQIQQVSLRAPADIKIDGNAKEWHNTFQAWTKVDKMFYTISNDDNNIYLIVGTEGPNALGKIMFGGITFTISHLIDKKKRENDAGNISVTFPVTNIAKGEVLVNGDYKYFGNLMNDTIKNKKEIDSLYFTMNKQATEAFKLIKVKGIKEIDDTLISIYNTTGIHAMAAFDRRIHYTYELAIPLKYFGISVNDGIKFSYNIKLNGPTQTVAYTNPNARGLPNMDVVGPPDNFQHIDPRMYFQNYPSDFWAEYTLAKK